MSPAAQQERIQPMCKTLKLDRVAIDYGGLAQTASDHAGLSPKQLVPQLADEGLYVWSRRIVGWHIAAHESTDVAAALITRA